MTLVYDAAAQPRVWVALSEEGGAYAEVVETLRAELPAVQLAAGQWTSFAGMGDAPPDLIVAVGHAAFEGMLNALSSKPAGWEQVPVLATLLPQSSYRGILSRGLAGKRQVSAVVLDQPLMRQLALIRHALSNRPRVAVLPGPQTRLFLGGLEREAAALGLTLVAAPAVNAPEDVFPSLKSALERADVLLALPDPLIYNSGSLQNILLTAYRARVPMVSFSPTYVMAGSLLSVYSTPAQIARQTAALLKRWQPGQKLPGVQHSAEFSVVANPKVAASLGIRLDDPGTIVEDLRRRESGS
jgi:ABC-type uncharacterized transport system substrate-binding protein